jgi:site-specific DNA-adenine methylase
MRLINYQYESEYNRRQWLDNMPMMIGLKYFGGKSMIGRYIINRICVLALSMKQKGTPANIFIDAFVGGGKIGLTMPNGWFDTIVLNDLNRAVYSYYISCKNNHVSLIKAIETLGGYMNSDMFNVLKRVTDNNYNKQYNLDDETMVLLGAFMYWFTQTSYNAITSIDKAKYLYNNDGEKEAINRIIKTSKNRIEQIHNKLNSQNYIIECMDYKELIKKYNTGGASKKNNILWYFDPPYHPYCLYAGDKAPYADTFSERDANEMIDILANKYINTYGELKYFIKSDYDPTEVFDKFVKVYNSKDFNLRTDNESNWIRHVVNDIGYDKMKDITSRIEDPTKGYRKECLGGFDKHTGRDKEAIQVMEQTLGFEYVWIRDKN